MGWVISFQCYLALLWFFIIYNTFVLLIFIPFLFYMYIFERIAMRFKNLHTIFSYLITAFLFNHYDQSEGVFELF